MTPIDVFQRLKLMFPKAWQSDEEQQVWGNTFVKALQGIQPETLEAAFDETIKSWSYAKPPAPGDILKNLPRQTLAIHTPAKPYERWPYRKKAHQIMLFDGECANAIRDGWGLGMWEFIAQHGRLPGAKEMVHLIETNKLFHRQYAVCGTGEKIEQPDGKGGTKMLPVEEQFRGLFEKLLERRDKILITYGG